MNNQPDTFENILDNCITAIYEQGKTVEECVALYPTRREELEPLLRLALRLQAARTLQAPSEFRRTSVTRVRNLIAARPRRVAQAAAEPHPLRRAWRRLTASLKARGRVSATLLVGVVLVISLFIGGGTVYASGRALPGDALYPLKRGLETMRLTVSLNDAEDARLYLAFASERLEEVTILLAENRPEHVENALTAYLAQFHEALTFLDANRGLPFEERSALADLAVTAQAHHEAQLAALLEQAPETARPALQRALTFSQAELDQALEMVGGEPGVPTEGPEHQTPWPTPSTWPTALSTPTAWPTPPERPTVHPTPTPWPTPTAWPTPPERPTARPTPTPWPTPSGWPTAWPTPPAWPTAWPTPPAWPTAWPTPPAWPTAWPTPPAWPTAWPTPPAWPTPHARPTLPKPPWPTPPHP
ncbi:MAG: hypothetical protein H5T62_06700 [Anaerolineae bacterium]|nr:hypothetical protein [Anaerolineae bacterium]